LFTQIFENFAFATFELELNINKAGQNQFLGLQKVVCKKISIDGFWDSSCMMSYNA
jgi:hypothetical protein